MEKEAKLVRHKGKSLIILGFVSIAILFLIYARFQNKAFAALSAAQEERQRVHLD